MIYTEQYFNDFAELPAEALSPNDSKVIYLVLTLDDEAFNRAFQDLCEKAWALRAMQKCVDTMDLKTDIRTLFLVHYMADGIIGHCLTVLYYLQHWQRTNQTAGIDKMTVLNRIFPHGFPAVEGINQLNERYKKIERIQSLKKEKLI